MPSFRRNLLAGLSAFLIGVILVSAANLFSWENNLLDWLMPTPSASIASDYQSADVEKDSAKEIYRVVASHSDKEVPNFTVVIQEELECSKDALYRGDDELWQMILSIREQQHRVLGDTNKAEPELELVGNYLMENQLCTGVERVGLENEYKFISKRELERLFTPDTDGWASFYSQYAHSSLLTFSKIGFNSTKTRALVYAANSCGWKCGHGDYFLLNKQNGAWEIVSILGSWTS